MLGIRAISKSIGIQPVLQDITFNISAGDRIGLIGPNGCGKTTLIRIVAGLETPDSGEVVSTQPNLRIGYLAQGLDFPPDQTLRTALSPEHVSMEELVADIAYLAAALVTRPDDQELQERYDSTLYKLSKEVYRPQSVLASLGLADIPLDTLISHLSGGQKTRLMLAHVLLQEPHLLLLDEPTNHLDISMLEWLETWLAQFSGAAMIVSHDRTFLDNTVTSILDLDLLTHRIRAYPGNYTDYVAQKSTEREKQVQEFQDQQDQLARLRIAAAHLRGLTRMRVGGKADGGDKFAKGFFANRATKGVAGRARHIEYRIEKLLTEDRAEKPGRSWQMKLDFGEPGHESRNVLLVENLSVGYTVDRPILAGLNLHIRARQRIALTGSNGSGKTTLIRTIAGNLAPLGGSFRLGQSVKIGYMAQEQELLDPGLTALETIEKVTSLNQTEARHFLHYFLFSGDDPLRPTRELSFGERARLQLGLLVAQGCTFLILDEPINHLDIPSRARFEQAMGQYQGTVLAVVHDRFFIDQFASTVWNLRDGKIEIW